MTTISFEQACFKVSERLCITIDHLQLRPGELLVLLGSNGSGKSLLARALCGRYALLSGSAPQHLSAALVSLEDQRQLFEDDYRLRNSDTLSAAEERGIEVAALLAAADPELRHQIFAALHIAPLLGKALTQLSGGEGRRVLLARALCCKPQLLVLDTPFEALDASMRQELLNIIASLHRQFSVAVVLIVNRADEIPPSAGLMGIIANLHIVRWGPRAALEADPELQGLLRCSQIASVQPPAPLHPVADFAPGSFLVLRNLSASYGGQVLFENFSLNLAQGEHCLITGPNGAGKSTLLSFITGDNPFAYRSDITIFGYRRGSGESIWDIKKHYGLVSADLHLAYRVSAPLLNVILSGFCDSIGLYRTCGDREVELGRRWLEIIALRHLEHHSFASLSFGQQRLALIARALIKGPALLILDEPLQGLDALGRALVRDYVGYFMQHTRTTVLYVSHHSEDAPPGFVRHLEFVPHPGGGCHIQNHLLTPWATPCQSAPSPQG